MGAADAPGVDVGGQVGLRGHEHAQEQLACLLLSGCKCIAASGSWQMRTRGQSQRAHVSGMALIPCLLWNVLYKCTACWVWLYLLGQVSNTSHELSKSTY